MLVVCELCNQLRACGGGMWSWNVQVEPSERPGGYPWTVVCGGAEKSRVSWASYWRPRLSPYPLIALLNDCFMFTSINKSSFLTDCSSSHEHSLHGLIIWLFGFCFLCRWQGHKVPEHTGLHVLFYCKRLWYPVVCVRVCRNVFCNLSCLEALWRDHSAFYFVLLLYLELKILICDYSILLIWG